MTGIADSFLAEKVGTFWLVDPVAALSGDPLTTNVPTRGSQLGVSADNHKFSACFPKSAEFQPSAEHRFFAFD
jgi:hypothetical protein